MKVECFYCGSELGENKKCEVCNASKVIREEMEKDIINGQRDNKPVGLLSTR